MQRSSASGFLRATTMILANMAGQPAQGAAGILFWNNLTQICHRR